MNMQYEELVFNLIFPRKVNLMVTLLLSMKKIPFGPLRSAHVSFNVGSAGHANCQYSWLVGVNLQSLVGQMYYIMLVQRNLCSKGCFSHISL